jgi:GNAT superfamily N-acetyltransferase
VRFVIREAELPADKELLLSTLLRNRNSAFNELRKERFEWSYTTNPYGKPRAWMAHDTRTNKCVGIASAFPRKILIDGKPLTCMNTGDTAVDKKLRSLGLAVRLLQKRQEEATENNATFLYSYPVDNMEVVLSHIGWKTIDKFPRDGIILKVNKYIEKYIKVQTLSSAISFAPNLLLASWWGNFSGKKGFQVKLQTKNKFESEYDDLFEGVSANYPVIGMRDSRFLTWRFLENPLHKNLLIFRLEEGNRLFGYALVDLFEDSARMVDYMILDEELTATLLVGILKWLRKNGICTFAVRLLSHNIFSKKLNSFGYIFTDNKDSSLTVYLPQNSPYNILLDSKKWYMTQADRDV